MDDAQRNHLKAYGLAYFSIKHDVAVQWLLNYRGGSFLIPFSTSIQGECVVRGVSYEVISSARENAILKEIAAPAVNMDIVWLETAPSIAVYSPKNELVTDDTDAVILVLGLCGNSLHHYL
jgi:hypothetical protein